MKKPSVLALAAVCAIVMALVFASAAAAKQSPFIGKWWSTDVDGSHQVVMIGGGPGDSHHIKYIDWGASVCGLDPDTGEILYAATAQGFLAGTGSVLDGNLPVICQASPPYFYNNTHFQFTYDAGTDTLTDAFGIVWYR